MLKPPLNNGQGGSWMGGVEARRSSDQGPRLAITLFPTVHSLNGRPRKSRISNDRPMACRHAPEERERKTKGTKETPAAGKKETANGSHCQPTGEFYTCRWFFDQVFGFASALFTRPFSTMTFVFNTRRAGVFFLLLPSYPHYLGNATTHHLPYFIALFAVFIASSGGWLGGWG